MKNLKKIFIEVFPFLILLFLFVLFLVFDGNKAFMTIFNFIFIGYALYIYAYIIAIVKNVESNKIKRYGYFIVITFVATAILFSRDSNNKKRGRYEQAIKTYDMHLDSHKCGGVNCYEAIQYEDEISKNEVNTPDDYPDF